MERHARKHSLIPVLATAFVAAPVAYANNLLNQQEFESATLVITQELDSLAARLAVALRDDALRNHVRNTALASNNRENILEGGSFFAQAMRDHSLGKQRSTIAPLAQDVAKITAQLKPLLAQQFTPGLDLYFPIKEHLSSWDGSDNLLVAYAPLGDEKQQASVVAYSVATGQAVALDPTTPPQTPTLVIAVEEHRSHNKPGVGGKAVPNHGDLHANNGDIDIATHEGLCADPNDHVCYMGTVHLKLNSDQEAWLLGDPEVYVLFAQAISAASAPAYKIYLDNVNDEGNWYIWTDTAVSPMYFSYQDSFGDPTYWRFREEDVGVSATVSASVSYGPGSLSVSWPVTNGDDDYGDRYVLKSEIGYTNYYTRSVGGADFCLDRDYDYDANY